ncbi:hypothetical protein ACNUDN_04282 [Mycobacterium sp. smrl_JER01]
MELIGAKEASDMTGSSIPARSCRVITLRRYRRNRQW